MSEKKKNIEEEIQALMKTLQSLIKEKPYAGREQTDILRAIARYRSWHIIEPLKEILNDSTAPNQLKREILDEFGRLGDPRVISILSKFLKDEDKSLKNSAAKGLSRIRNVKVVEPLLEAIKDEEKWVRIFAINGLVKNQSKHCVTPIINRLTDENAEVREEAVKALERMDTQIIKEDILKALEDENRIIKRGAAAVCGTKRINESSDKLIELLGTGDRALSLIASRSLSRIGDINSIPKMLLLASQSDGIDSIYSTSIQKMGPDVITPLTKLYIIAEDDSIKDLIVELLQKYSQKAVEEVSELMSKISDPEEREQVQELFKQL